MTRAAGQLATVVPIITAELERIERTPRWLAREAGVAATTVSRWLNGEAGVSLEIANQILGVLGMGVEVRVVKLGRKGK
jgi:plasmid maintenance system antidote protein VapI